MLSSVQNITQNCEDKEWDMHIKGLEFESLIYNMIAYDLNQYYKQGVDLIKTENTRDGGVDIIIKSSVSLNLMGQNYALKGKKEIKIYIECKYSKKANLQLDKFSKNLLLLKDKEIDYFLLVSNSTISPHSFWQAQNMCNEQGIDFKFVGHLFLSMYLRNHEYYNNMCEIPNPIPSLSICYQTEKIHINGQMGLNLYLYFRNNLDKVNACTFKLKSDRNWALSEHEFEITIDAMDSVCKKILVEKVNFDGNDDILLDFIFNGSRKTIQVSGINLEYNFVLPFFGEEHRKLFYEITNKILDNLAINQLCLVGEAGIGKSRLIDESFNLLCTKGISCGRVFVTKDDDIDDIQLKIRNKFQIQNVDEDDSLENIINQLSANKYMRYLIVLEDVHNAPNELFQQIRGLEDFNNKNIPVSLILTGRDDHSIHNESFYAYIDWAKHKDNNNTIIYRKVNRFDSAECKKLIRAIINDSPSYVIEKIANFSRGNPFYLVQYIEYLLETKLIFLISKNTVGITNAATFDQHMYVPEKIEELLNLRLGVLKNQTGSKLFEFLLILAYVGFNSSKEYWNSFFSEQERDRATVLFKNHFIRLSNDEIIFDHESIYMVLKKALESSENRGICYKHFIDSPDLFEMLPSLKKAAIYLYIDEKAAAAECLKAPIKELKGLSNISSVNLNPLYYDYYETIYKLSKENKDKDLQKNTLVGTIYVAMHNLSKGDATLAFEWVNEIFHKDFKSDTHLKITISVLNAHYMMSMGQMSQAKGIILELLSLERIHPDLFDEQSRFNLFDRASSLYLQENHIQPAIQYNKLSYDIAKNINDYRLMTLSKIIEAKISFFINTKRSIELIKEADKLLEKEPAIRISCHNKIGMLTTEIMLHPTDNLDAFIERGNRLLQDAIDISYPLALMRINYILAVLHYIRNNDYDIELSKKYLDDGIEIAIRNGNIKLLPNYYMLKLIIAVNEDQPFDTLHKYANTVLEYLQQQNLLFLGSLDFGYSNLINITNYAIFANKYLSETDYYKFLQKITYYGSDEVCDLDCKSHKVCSHRCTKNREICQNNFRQIKKGNLLFLPSSYKYRLKDSHTDFFIPLGL